MAEESYRKEESGFYHGIGPIARAVGYIGTGSLVFGVFSGNPALLEIGFFFGLPAMYYTIGRDHATKQFKEQSGSHQPSDLEDKLK